MSKKVFFKIVVPNYNNMPYIKKCLDSILQQTFQDFFIVVVDDMSTDCSDKFCEAYEHKFPDKLKLLRLEKKGYAGAARNRALEWDGVEPEYIWFVDSDDWLYDKDVLKNMYSKIVEAKMPDMLRCSAVFRYNEHRQRFVRAWKNAKTFAVNGGICTPWTCCIKSKFSNVLFLPDRAKHNDVIWFARLLDAIDLNKIEELAKPCCVYNIASTTSCQNSKIVANTQMCKDAVVQCKEDLEALQPKTEIAQKYKNYQLNVFRRRLGEKKLEVVAKPNEKIDETKTEAPKITITTKQHIANEKVIVSMTSWKKRIDKVEHVVKLLLNNTIKPDKIILNLSADEFQHKEADLPKSLVNMQKNCNKFEIYWVKQNTKPYKKTIHTLRRFPDDVIITVDDDVEYPHDFIETMLRYYTAYGKQCPITAGTYKWKNNLFSHYGCFSLIKKEFVGDYLDDLYENLVLKDLQSLPFADPVIMYAVLLNGRRYQYTTSMNMTVVRRQTHDNSDAISKLGTNQHKMQMAKEHQILQEYILKKYGKTYNQLVDAPVIVNCTTYPARDKYLYKTLQSIKQQSLLPNEVILHLAEDEYCKEQLPQTIQQCIDDRLVTSICWSKMNTYCFKRYSLFAENAYAYNILIDDDIAYRKDFIQELVQAAHSNQDCIVNTATSKIDYICKAVKISRITQAKSNLNAFMGGRTCFPPYILPVNELFNKKIDKLRHQYVKKCDESWLKPVLYKHDIKVLAIRDQSQYKFNTIAGTQDTALYNENNHKTCINGSLVREKERNFFNAIKILDAEDTAKKLFPNLDIKDWSIMENIHDIATQSIKPIDGNTLKCIEDAKTFNKDVLKIKDIDQPKTMTEKLRYICTYGVLDDVKCMCTDKLMLHKFCKYVLGNDICIPTLKIFDTADSIDIAKLPDSFVLKANHGCGFNLLVDDKAKYDNKKLVDIAQKWLKTDLSQRIHETHYSRIVPKVYAETYMHDGKDKSLTDYKFLCFNGMPKYCQVINDRHTAKQRLNYYDMNFKFIDICRNEFKNNPKMLDQKPKTWSQMVATAMKFATYFDFVRVDLYEIDGKVYLGELTFTPGAGKFTYKNPNDNIKLGNMLKLADLKSKYYSIVHKQN